MKTSKTILTLITIIIYFNLNARNNPNNGNKSGGTNPTPAAGCAQAVALATLDLNNVRTRIEGTGGSMFEDRANSIAAYEVPKRLSNDDPLHTSIFAGALWMGGQDVNGQLKIAATTYRQNGSDFYPGPLNTSTAEIDAATCSKFDKFFGVSRAMIDEFVGWYQAGLDDAANGTNTQQENYPGYKIPNVILNWPAHGDPSLGQDWHLAPFYDRNGDDFYDPNDGDYPKYDLIGDIDCRVTRDVRLFGDTTIWFVFNDKGNTHTETQGPSIGMEIRGQAFAFATNDEVNNMTFYNYEMINRSTFTLANTYFGQWIDSDLGAADDDYVGCDAARGLGYCYNGDPNDQSANGVTGYGTTPPAVGVDFFEGPYADNDGIDNPLTQIVQDAIDSNGIPYSGLGIGYGDGVVDNERYGMRKFVYYSIVGGQFNGDGDPQSALDYYNYLRGRWRNGGAKMVWGGNGNAASSGGTVLADLLFPGDSDPLFWSTHGIAASPASWSEFNANNGNPNPIGDRRFLESAGPFTLEPGAVNDLTVGVVWSRASTGDNLASISTLKVADDKAQALFDNCFKVSEGPDAPDVSFQEMENELILYLSNRSISNNYNESYDLKDPFIAIPDTLNGVYQGTEADKDTLKFYKFQGYQIYQVKNSTVSVTDLDNLDLARLVAQVDIKDGINQLVNYTYDDNLHANVPKEMVNGADKGIKHSFVIQNDLFASGDNKLVNHKTYYYMAIAYGYNEYKHYDPLDPQKLDGQKKPYIASRKMAGGQGIRPFSAIPHNPAPEAGGTLAQAKYGDQPQITRVDGQGNGGNNLELTEASEVAIVSTPISSGSKQDVITYKAGKGPIQVQVVDPLSVKAGKYTVAFKDSTGGGLGDAYWTLHTPTGDSINADQSIAVENEQLILNEGISITIKQSGNAGDNRDLGNGLLTSSIEYADSSKPWLGGFSDQEGQTDANWIRSGNSVFDVGTTVDPYNDYDNPNFLDPKQDFEGIINGTWAPYRMVSYIKTGQTSTGLSMQDAVGMDLFNGSAVRGSALKEVPSVDIVFTNDKSKWSRCMVLESRNDANLAQGNAKYLQLRQAPSVDKSGKTSADAGYNNSEGDLVSTTGMGWFPGYAVNVETGERLNIAFAEDSWLAGENGRDMKWNPTSTMFAGVNNELRMGGKHYVYVFRSQATPSFPAYDDGAYLFSQMNLPAGAGNDVKRMTAMKTCVWAGIPMLNDGYSLLATDAKVKLRVERSYKNYTTAALPNGGLPMYTFDMTGLETETNNTIAIDSALAMINVVPNPYYASSEYETDQLDNRIKIVNLPEECTISIYNVNGTLMRRFVKGDKTTYLDWDLKNHAGIPIAGGVYLIHVDVPNVGQRTLKWFGVIKPTDLNGF